MKAHIVGGGLADWRQPRLSVCQWVTPSIVAIVTHTRVAVEMSN
jgi:hypothetical protein